MIKVKRTVEIRRGRQGRRPKERGQERSQGRIPRVSRLMALAIKFDGLINDGVIADRSELARLSTTVVTRIRSVPTSHCVTPDGLWLARRQEQASKGRSTPASTR